MAHFELPPGKTSKTTANLNFDEIWYFLSGRGEMWRKHDDSENVVPVDPGVCLTIPAGTHFQFCSFGYCPLAAIGVTMPPWTEKSAWEFVKGKWESDIS
jgi:mannose-6-phosphate isomerase-like protein (cupin superfamily)